MVIILINFRNRRILCNTNEEAKAILEKAKLQGIKWCTGKEIDIEKYNVIPIVFTFGSDAKLSWNDLDDATNVGYFITDLAKDLLNTDREMTAHEFLNKFLDMAYHCSNCEECKTIKAHGVDYKWCDSDFWSKDNIDQVYEIVKTGNKLKEDSKQKAINNLNELLVNLCDEDYTKSLRVAIKVLEEKLNEEQK